MEEETAGIARKRERKDSALALRKLENDEPGAKSKKKARVLVEVGIYVKSFVLNKIVDFPRFSISFQVYILHYMLHRGNNSYDLYC